MGNQVHVVVLLVVALAALGCAREGASGEPQVETESTSIAKDAVSRIVFLDLEDACECKRSRIDASWNALQDALSGAHAAPPVERIHMDNQPGQATPYQNMKPVMVAPALYFLDDDSRLVSFLQGEVSDGQISESLRAVTVR